MKKQHRYACLGMVSLLGLSLTGFSQARLNAVNRRPDAVDRMIARGSQEDSIGNRQEAIAVTDRAADILLTHVEDGDARARLNECALSFSQYGERQQAIALLNRIKSYRDPAGKQSAKFYDEITHADPAWRTAPIPSKAMIAFRKAILKNRPNSSI